MNVNKITSYDESLRLSVAQDITADVAGQDAGAVPIVLDLGNFKNQAVQLNLKVQATAALTVVAVKMQSSNSATFATGVFVDETLFIDETAAVAAPKAYATTGFVPKGRYVRVFYDWTSGVLTDATAWAAFP